MSEVSATDCADDGFVSQEAMKHHLAAQAAIDERRMKAAEQTEWVAAGICLAVFIVSIGALLAANALHVWG